MLVAFVKGYFGAVGHAMPPDQFLKCLSEHLRGLRLEQSFMGMSLLYQERPPTDPAEPHTFWYANAGMPPLIHYRAQQGEAIRIDQPAMFLGTDLDINYRQERITAYPGDRLVFLSDGLTEARNNNGKFLPYQKWLETIATHGQAPCAILTDALEWTLKGHLGEGRLPQDDATILTIAIEEPAVTSRPLIGT